MKISAIVLTILMVGLIFAMIGSVANDMEVQYPDIDINDSTWQRYDFQDELAGNSSLLIRAIEGMNNEDTHWLFRGLAGIAAIPVAIFTAISIFLKSIGMGALIITGIGTEVGVPSFVIGFAIVAFTLTIIFKIIGWWHRKDI